MEKSSYSTEYLNYGHIPTYSHKNDGISPSLGVSLAVKASSYQQEYKEKLALTNNIDFKELDCYQNKFK